MTNNGPSIWGLVGLGTTMAGLVIGSTALGWFVDSRLKSFPTFILVGVALGIVLASVYTYAAFRKFMEK
jgi:F0F1-type ATP synthase assembly protein I